MGWESYHRRREALDAVIEHARRHPGGALPVAEVPQAVETFGDAGSLALALQSRWMQILSGHVNVALEEVERAEHGLGQEEAVTRAWRRAAARHPALRRLLDEQRHTAEPELRAAFEREQRMLALTAGLATADEPVADITRIGAAYAALLRQRPRWARPAKRRFAAGQPVAGG